MIAFVTTVLSVAAMTGGAAFGLFGHRCGRINANETAAIATMRNLHSAQQQFHEVVGRHGTFLELSGVAVLPETGAPLEPPVLSGAFRQPLPDGTILRSGYRFRIVCVGKAWCAWSWPEQRMTKQRRTFFVGGAVGDIVHATEIDAHEGDRGPADGDDGVWTIVH